MSILLALWLVFVFVLGAVVGSFLNVAIARLPLEKSLIWPSSRCGNCLQPVRWYDNLPLVSYWVLRGRCRSCGMSFSSAYFLVELGTGLGFAGLFLLEVVLNVHGWPAGFPTLAAMGFFPATSWLGFSYHALLFALLVVASVCDLNSREIPLQLTLFGTAIGLVGAVLLPWPYPWPPSEAAPAGIPGQGIEMAWQAGGAIREGIYLWPVWGPLPSWLAPGGNWQTGLVTGIVGALVGTFMTRIIGAVFSIALDKEALGLGDADLMMMAGAFLGWQVVAVAFFLSAAPALVFGIVGLVSRNDNALPFGPSLSIGVLGTMLGWRWIGAYPGLRILFFWAPLLVVVVLVGVVVLFLTGFVLRRLHGAPAPADGDGPAA